MNALLELRGRRGWLALVCALALGACGHNTPTVQIVGFGPTPVEHGKSFNVQPNGDSAIWVRTDKPADPHDVLVLDGHQLRTTISGNLLTAPVPLSVIATPGPKPLLVEFGSPTQRAQSPAVSFVVN
jgi:hypothetical protein